MGELQFVSEWQGNESRWLAAFANFDAKIGCHRNVPWAIGNGRSDL